MSHFPTSPLLPNTTLWGPYLILTPSGVLLLVKYIEHKKKGEDLLRQTPTKMASVLLHQRIHFRLIHQVQISLHSDFSCSKTTWCILRSILYFMFLLFHPEIILELHVVHKHLRTISWKELPLENKGNPELWWIAVTTMCMIKVRLTLGLS